MTLQRFIAILCITILFSFSGTLVVAAENPINKTDFSETEALNLAQEWSIHVSQADVTILEMMLSDAYQHIHATALVETKAQFLEAFKNGTRKYDPIKIEDANVRLFGNVAIVTGKFNLKAFARGKTIEGVNRFNLVLTKTAKGMQVVSFQATGIPQQ